MDGTRTHHACVCRLGLRLPDSFHVRLRRRSNAVSSRHPYYTREYTCGPAQLLGHKWLDSVLRDVSRGVIGGVVTGRARVVPRAVPAVTVGRHMLVGSDGSVRVRNPVDAEPVRRLTIRAALVHGSFAVRNSHDSHPLHSVPCIDRRSLP